MSMSPKLLRPKASGFNPASIAGLVHWWDANDSSTLTFSTGVSEWRSKAGTKTAATQSTANNQPTTTTVNGKTALLFDGSNDGFDFSGTARTDETWIVVAAQTEDQTGSRALVNDGDSGGGLLTVSIVPAGRTVRAEYATGIPSGTTEGVARITVGASVPVVTQAMPASVISAPRSSAGGQQIRINGSLRESVITGGLTSSSTTGNVSIKRIGYYSSALFQFKGWIGEVLCWSRVLTVAEMQTVEKALGKKWGITVA
jgi:hypothetical protein